MVFTFGNGLWIGHRMWCSRIRLCQGWSASGGIGMQSDEKLASLSLHYVHFGSFRCYTASEEHRSSNALTDSKVDIIHRIFNGFMTANRPYEDIPECSKSIELISPATPRTTSSHRRQAEKKQKIKFSANNHQLILIALLTRNFCSKNLNAKHLLAFVILDSVRREICRFVQHDRARCHNATEFWAINKG